jgi:hypothetical protein
VVTHIPEGCKGNANFLLKILRVFYKNLQPIIEAFLIFHHRITVVMAKRL